MCQSNDNAKDASSINGQQQQQQQPQQQPKIDVGRAKILLNEYLSKLCVRDLVNPNKPWILVENGNFMGFFEFVPSVFRVGPWAAGPMMFIAGAIYYTLFSFCYHFSQYGLIPADLPNQYYEAYTIPWYFNFGGFLWTSYVFRDLFVSGLGMAGMTTWTVQSYFYLLLRYLFTSVAPFYPNAAIIGELLRFPVLSQATVVFVIWNFVLAPTLFYFCLKDEARRQIFVKYFGSFRLIQLHCFNIVLAIHSGIWGSPSRSLQWTDLHAAMALGLQYFCFYVLILDRLGIHFYLIFSPRTNLCILSLSAVIIATFTMYPFWDRMITQYGEALVNWEWYDPTTNSIPNVELPF